MTSAPTSPPPSPQSTPTPVVTDVAALAERISQLESEMGTLKKNGLDNWLTTGAAQPVSETYAGDRTVFSRANHGHGPDDIHLGGSRGEHFGYGDGPGTWFADVEFQIEKYGGGVDKTDVENTAAFLRAYALFPSTGGCIRLSGGTYRFTTAIGSLTVPIHVKGSGRSITVIDVTTSTGDLFLVDTFNFLLTDLSIRASTIDRTAGYWFVNLNSGGVANLHRFGLIEYSGGLRMGAVSIVDVSDFIMVTPAVATAIAISVSDTDACTVHSGLLLGQGAGTGIQVLAAQDCTFIDVRSIVHTYNVELAPTTSTAYSVNFEQCEFDQARTTNVRLITASTGSVYRVKFLGCWISGSLGDGFYSTDTGGGTLKGVTIQNCNIFGNGGIGINADTGSTGIEIFNSNIAGNTSHGIKMANGVTEWKVIGNQIGTWADFFGNGGYGLSIGTGNTGYIYYGNRFLGNTSGSVDEGSLGIPRIAAPNMGDQDVRYLHAYSADVNNIVGVSNADASGVSALAGWLAASDSASIYALAHGSGRVATRYGVTLGGFTELLGFTGGGLLIGTGSLAVGIIFGTANATRFTMDGSGNLVVGSAAIGTTATNGFFYNVGTAGAPTGVPTSYTGRVPTVIDTTNHRPYFNDGSWRYGLVNTQFAAKGDLISASAASTPQIITIGANGTVMQAASGLPSWVTVGTMLAILGATKGDTFYSPSNAGAILALPIGSSNDLYTVSSGLPAWQSVATMLGATVMTTNGDFDYRNGSGIVTRFPVGTNDDMMYVASSLPAWGSQATVLGKTLTNRGSLLRSSAAGVAAQLNVGAVATFLRSDGTDPGYTALNNIADMVRITGNANIGTGGAALELQWSGSAAQINGFDRGAGTYQPFVLNALSGQFLASAAEKFKYNGTGVGFFGATPVAQTAAYTVTNPTTDRALNVTADTLAQGLQVLGTLIADLKLLGLLG